jgi:hypothetical protein
VRLLPHTAQHLRSVSLGTTPGSVPSPCSSLPGVPRGPCARSLGTFPPVCPQARGRRPGDTSPGPRLSRAPTPTPPPTLPSGLALSCDVSPALLPTALAIPQGVSRVRHGELTHDGVGGTCSSPHPRAAAPQYRQRGNRGLSAPFGRTARVYCLGLSYCPGQCRAGLARLSGQVCEGQRSPEGAACCR